MTQWHDMPKRPQVLAARRSDLIRSERLRIAARIASRIEHMRIGLCPRVCVEVIKAPSLIGLTKQSASSRRALLGYCLGSGTLSQIWK